MLPFPRTLGRVIGLLALTPALALAHGRLLRSTPSANSRTPSAPREVQLTFSEPVELAVARVQLLGANGRAVALAKPALADAGRTVRAAIPTTLAAGTYTVSWRVAGRDGHPVAGTFRFTVGGAAAAPAAAGGATGAADAHAGHGAMHTDSAHAGHGGAKRPPSSR